MVKKRNRDMVRRDRLRQRGNREKQRITDTVHKTEMESVTERRREREMGKSLFFLSLATTQQGKMKRS